jgi:hypothetical protein
LFSNNGKVKKQRESVFFSQGGVTKITIPALAGKWVFPGLRVTGYCKNDGTYWQ